MPTLMFPLVNITILIKCSSLNIHEIWDVIFQAANENKGKQYGRIKLIHKNSCYSDLIIS